MAQTGCPQGTGTGGSGKESSRPSSTRNRHGARAPPRMARAASPDSGEQSILHSASTKPRFLNNQYTVWGKVTEGMEKRRQGIKARRAGTKTPTRSSRRIWQRDAGVKPQNTRAKRREGASSRRDDPRYPSIFRRVLRRRWITGSSPVMSASARGRFCLNGGKFRSGVGRNSIIEGNCVAARRGVGSNWEVNWRSVG